MHPAYDMIRIVIQYNMHHDIAILKRQSLFVHILGFFFSETYYITTSYCVFISIITCVTYNFKGY